MLNFRFKCTTCLEWHEGLPDFAFSAPYYYEHLSAEQKRTIATKSDDFCSMVVVGDLRFDQTSVVAGSSYSLSVSGSNLTSETFLDVRFISPGSNESAVVLNWQRGLAASHDVAAGTASGTWTINGVRAHEIETDHTGDFVPVSATITVSR